LIGPLGFAGKNLSRRGFHAILAFLGLSLTVTSTTFLLLLGQGLYSRLGVNLSAKGTFGIDWLFFGYLLLSLILITIVGILSTSYLVSSMINQRMRDIGVIKAAGALPRRLFSYAFVEGLLVVSASCLVGAIAAFLIYIAWSWPSPNLFGQVGPVPEAGATILAVVPVASFLLSYLTARYHVGKIIKFSTVSAITGQLSGLNLKSLGNPLKVRRLGSAFNLASRNVSRDRELNRTLVRIGICIFLAAVVLTGALVSADTSRDYVQRAMPAGVLLVANSAVHDQYSKLGTAFSNTAPIPAFDYTNQTFIINQQEAIAFRNLTGVERVDSRLITMSAVGGYIKAHLVSNETSGNYNNVYVPEVYLGSTQALLVGIDPSSVIGDWYTSDGFLQSTDNQTTIIAGDSLVGGIVQSPFTLAQVSVLGMRYSVKSALVDPLNAGRVLYAPIRSLQAALGVAGYNILLVETSNSPAVVAAVENLAASYGLVVGSMDQLLNANLGFLNSTWSYFFILPVLTLALTCGILLSYLTTNFSRRFNDYLVLRLLGAKAWYSLRLLLWEAWGLLAVCMVISIPLALLVSIFFLVPEASLPAEDLGLAAVVSVVALTAVSLASALIYSRRLRLMTVKDLRG
jgi:ABC-type antimicrobial peptide transport system permease subunit